MELSEPHLLLKWLVTCERIYKQPRPCRLPNSLKGCKNIADALEALNATLPEMNYTNLVNFETQLATWIHQNECTPAVLTYFAYSMYRWRGACRVYGVPISPGLSNPPLFKWLTPEYVKRGLVVPDIRKLATEIWYTAELRPGECEWVRAIDPMATFSGASLVQQVRPIEYCSNTRHVLQYGTSDAMYESGLLNYVYLAMIDIRLRNRIQLDWKTRCVRFPSTISPADLHSTCPLLFVTPRRIHVLHKDQRVVYEDASVAFMAWHHMCEERCRGVIDGRWHVRHYTI